MGNSRFWIGMMAGVVVGAVVYHCARSEKAKEIKAGIAEKLKQMYEQSGECVSCMADKAVDAGVRAADKLAERAEDAKEKVHNLARDLRS
ncbi:MAG: YtxH domain-containing protein [Bacteroidaceae bacterium]|nr:YtxH domain-containing protein [Bacteroidaceae bacterium]